MVISGHRKLVPSHILLQEHMADAGKSIDHYIEQCHIVLNVRKEASGLASLHFSLQEAPVSTASCRQSGDGQPLTPHELPPAQGHRLILAGRNVSRIGSHPPRRPDKSN
ncbi:hypothetical protein E2K99_06205 [Herbaspirillum huttiense]|nr:hypothetical protein [Herbaspirillum huttiense]QBP74627.1 hypothetical protein E2K99_06205 [Herbaspirillum huttiense]